MKKLLILLVFVSVFADETTHVVKTGDTLWDIAGWYYQDPFLWPYIWRANLTTVEDPHWIYPEEELVIPPSPEEGVTIREEPVYYPYTVPPKKMETEIISTVKPEERIFSEEMIHRAGFIVEEDIPYWSKIVGTEPKDEDLITSFLKIYFDRVDGVDEGMVLTVYREGQDLNHPETGEWLGKEIIILGKVEVQEIGEEGSRGKVVASYDVIKEGDLLIPYEPTLAPENVELIPTEKDVEAFVVEVRDENRFTPPHVFVYVDQGEETGTAVGDIYTIYQEREVAGKKMPDFDIGEIHIVSVFRKASIGLLSVKRQTIRVDRGEKCRLAMEAR